VGTPSILSCWLCSL